MEFYVKFYNAEEHKKLQGTVFFENDPYIAPMKIGLDDECSTCDSYEGDDIRDEEIDAVREAMHKIKEMAPSSRIGYMSNQDMATGWMMYACSFEDEKDIHELEDFYTDADFESDEWFEAIREGLGMHPIASCD